MAEKKRAYSYIRMSSAQQLQGDSLRRQLERTREYAAENNLELDETLRDIGVSAYKGKNRTLGALKRLVELIDGGRIEAGSVLIIESLDRLTREQTLDAFEFFVRIVNAHIEIVTLVDKMRYVRADINANPGLLFLVIGVLMRAHDESRTKSDRGGAAWAAKRRKAAEEGRPITRQIPAWLKLSADGKCFEVVQERAEIVRRIFQLAASGLGKRKIAQVLNQEGVSTWGPRRRPRGPDGRILQIDETPPSWKSSYIVKILSSEAVLGTFQAYTHRSGQKVPDGPPIKDYFPAIIDETLYWAANGAREARKKSCAGRKGPTYGNLFSGIVVCSKCHSTMRYMDKGPKKGGRYYICVSYTRKMQCTYGKTHRVEAVERAVLSGIVAGIDMTRVVSSETSERAIVSQARDAADVEAKAKRSEIDRLLATFGDDIGTMRSVAERVRKLETEAAEAEELSAAADRKLRQLSASGQGPGERRAAIAELVRQMEAADGEELYRLRAAVSQEVKRAVERIRLCPDGAIMLDTAGCTYMQEVAGGPWIILPHIDKSEPEVQEDGAILLTKVMVPLLGRKKQKESI